MRPSVRPSICSSSSGSFAARLAGLGLAFSLVLPGCAAGQADGLVCDRDAQCDPGDLCAEGICAPESALTASGFSINPTGATVSALAGDPVPSSTFLLSDSSLAGHSFAVACSDGLAATPTSGKVKSGAPVKVQVQPPPQPTARTVKATCKVTSPTSKSLKATYSLTVSIAARGGGGGGQTGSVGPTGGTVDLLDFVATGDTRPPACGDTAHYPTAVHAQVVQAMAKANPQFAIDLGDHLFVCDQNLQTAQAQMNLYTQGLAGFPAQFFMTMGNHECEAASCVGSKTDANYSVFTAALLGVSHQTSPNYAVQIQTRLGRATVVVNADNAFDPAWLEQVLADADAHSTYTIVVKHHPITGSRQGPAGPLAVIQKHKFSLVLTAHNHDYEHDTVSWGGRSVICGLGGANPAAIGYCRVQQLPDGRLQLTQFDVAGNPADSWSVPAR